MQKMDFINLDKWRVLNEPLFKSYIECFSLLENKAETLDELQMLKDRLDDLTNFDFAEESMIYSMHMAEQGSEAAEKEKTYAQIQRINEYLMKLEALNQMEHLV